MFLGEEGKAPLLGCDLMKLFFVMGDVSSLHLISLGISFTLAPHPSGCGGCFFFVILEWL